MTFQSPSFRTKWMQVLELIETRHGPLLLYPVSLSRNKRLHIIRPGLIMLVTILVNSSEDFRTALLKGFVKNVYNRIRV